MQKETLMNKTIVITGATGFVGKKLCLELFLKGYQLRILCRSIENAKQTIALPADFILWNGSEDLSSQLFEGTHAIIHLAGEPIAGGRWTKKQKEKILISRTESTQKICEAVKKCKAPPQVMIGASAIGIYGNVKDQTLSESAPVGSGFLAEVCKKWEHSYQGFNGRLVMLRTGVVLGHGGALSKMLLPFRLGAGGKLANGQQWMSWIHLDDLVNLYIFALENDSLTGAINAVSPNTIKNSEFTKKLSHALGMPAIIPVPAFILKLIFGEMSNVLLDSQRVSSEKALKYNFNFKYSDLDSALKAILSPNANKGCHSYFTYQWVNKDKETAFDFFSQAENLEVITPPWLNFKITHKSDANLKEGSVIDYKLKIKGVPISWKTLISKWSAPDYFIDIQLKGPYSKWEHTHRFISINNGTLLIDEIIYKAPLGLIGYIVNELMIAKDVAAIFKYRNKQIKKLLN